MEEYEKTYDSVMYASAKRMIAKHMNNRLIGP